MGKSGVNRYPTVVRVRGEEGSPTPKVGGETVSPPARLHYILKLLQSQELGDGALPPEGCDMEKRAPGPGLGALKREKRGTGRRVQKRPGSGPTHPSPAPWQESDG